MQAISTSRDIFWKVCQGGTQITVLPLEYLFSQTGEVLENKCDDNDIANCSSTPLSDIDDSQ